MIEIWTSESERSNRLPLQVTFDALRTDAFGSSSVPTAAAAPSKRAARAEKEVAQPVVYCDGCGRAAAHGDEQAADAKTQPTGHEQKENESGSDLAEVERRRTACSNSLLEQFTCLEKGCNRTFAFLLDSASHVSLFHVLFV